MHPGAAGPGCPNVVHPSTANSWGAPKLRTPAPWVPRVGGPINPPKEKVPYGMVWGAVGTPSLHTGPRHGMEAQPYFLPSVTRSSMAVWSPKARSAQPTALKVWAGKQAPSQGQVLHLGTFLGQWVAHTLSCVV